MKKLKIISLIAMLSILLISCSSKKQDQKDDETKKENLAESIENTLIEENMENKSERESQNETSAEIVKVIENSKSDIKATSLVEISNDFPVYENALNAKNKVSSTKNYTKGNYFVYKITKDAINLSKDPNNAGGWANFEDVNIDKNNIPEENFYKADNSNKQESKPVVNSKSISQTSSSKENVLTEIKSLNLSSKTNSWSYAYPKNLDLLSKYNGYNKISTSGKNLYLTFDNGYEYKNNTSKILDILERNNVKATFFTTGQFIRQNPAITKRIANQGHNLANHSEKHINQGKSSAADVYDDIKNWETTAKSVIKSNKFAKLMRPPEGSYSERSLFIANKLGYKTIFWNYAYGDWDTNNQPDPEASLQKLLKKNTNGSIILLHSVSDTNVKILERFIKESQRQGYSFKLL